MKVLALVVIALTTVTVAATSALAATKAPEKVWLCHKTSATFTTDAGTFTKFVPTRVAGRALVRAHLAHGDARVLPVPTGTFRAKLKAAKAFCQALRITAPVTPTTGGVKLEAALAGSGVTADLAVRTQVGQRRLCFVLQVNVPAGATVQLSSLALTRASTTVTIGSAQLTSTSASGCVTLASKADARVLLSGNVLATLTGALSPAGGGGPISPFHAVGTLSAANG
jgi:hypothetical protein